MLQLPPSKTCQKNFNFKKKNLFKWRLKYGQTEVKVKYLSRQYLVKILTTFSGARKNCKNPFKLRNLVINIIVIKANF